MRLHQVDLYAKALSGNGSGDGDVAEAIDWCRSRVNIIPIAGVVLV